jgi:hypothetical protein
MEETVKNMTDRQLRIALLGIVKGMSIEEAIDIALTY